jgi:hypothetical protein
VFNLFWWWCRQQIMWIIHFYEFILKLKLKPAFLLLCYVSIMCSFVCGQQLFQVFKFLNTHSKIFKKFCPSFFRRPNWMWGSPSSSLARDTLRIQYFRSGAQPRGWGGLPGCSPPKPQKQKLKKKNRFRKYHDIESFPWFSVQPKSTTEISCWLVH